MKPIHPLSLRMLTFGAALTTTAAAASDSWKANAAGDWNNTASWTDGNIPGSTVALDSTDIATFGFTLTAGRIVTVDANRNIGGITFSNTSTFGYTLSSGNLKLSSGGLIQSTGAAGAHTDTISSAIEIQGDGGAGTFTNSALNTRIMSIGAVSGVSGAPNNTSLLLNGTSTGANAITGVISNGGAGGTLGLTKSDSGTWSLQNNGNSYGGGTTINAGTLQALAAGSLGSGTVTLAGGQLHLINNANTAFNNNVEVTGNAQISSTKVSGQSGDISHTLGTLGIGNSTLTLGKFFNTTSGTLNFGAVTLTGDASFATNASTSLVLGAVGGEHSITKGGAGATGTLVLSGNNTHSGGTNLNVGTLQVGTGGATGTFGSGPVALAAGTTLTISRGNSATFNNEITGTGTVRIASGANAIVALTNASHAGATQVLNGVFQTNNTGSNIVLGTVGSTFVYPVLGLTSAFTGSLGTSPGGISWAAGNNTSGGFAVMDAATREVNIGGNVTPDTLTLGTGGFVGGTLSGNNSRLKFGDLNGIALGTVDFKNSINLGAGTRSLIIVADGTAQAAGNISGNISGSGLAAGTGDAIVKFGNGNLMLSGINTYTGRTVVGGNGSVILGSAGAFSSNTWMHLDGGNNGTIGGILGIGAADLNADLGTSGGQVHFAASGGFAAFGANRPVTLNGGAELVWASTPSFLGNNQNLILGQAKADAKITLTNDINLNGATRTIHLNDGMAAIDGELSGSLSGGADASLVKAGAGTLRLSGSSTYTGTTTVSAGTLLIDGSLGNSAVTVNPAAMIGGSGVIAGSVTVEGTLSPGSSIESLGAGDLSFSSSSTYAYELDSSTPNGDLTYSTGAIDIAGGSILTFTELNAGLLAMGTKLSLISYNGTWNGGLFTYLGDSLADNSSFDLGGNYWRFDYNDNGAGSNFPVDQAGGSRFVTMTVIPEPSAALLGISAFGLTLLRRRRIS
jgi:autotransporter-associated beta strand protein